MNIKVILMDIGGVVFINTATEKDFTEMTKIFGFKIGVNPDILNSVRKEFLHESMIGKFTNKDYFAEVAKRSRKNLPNDIEDIWVDTASAGIIINHSLLEWVTNIRRTHKVYIFSTISSLRFSLDLKLDIYKWFDGRYLSTEMGMTKSNPQFFTKVIEELNVHPSEALLIDDQDKNIHLAKELGINAFKFEEKHFRNPDLFLKAMSSFGL
jgi:FMN phosphatase YigB (HAD superfamily)